MRAGRRLPQRARTPVGVRVGAAGDPAAGVGGGLRVGGGAGGGRPGDRHGTLGYARLVDSPAAALVLPAVPDALAEFAGTPVGLAAVQGLAGV